MTKRGILSKVARVYDLLRLVSLCTLAGKLLYREACESKVGWDSPLKESLAKRVGRWENGLGNSAEFRRSLAGKREDIEEINLHTFGDASSMGVAAAVHAVVKQPSGTLQGLVTAKSRLPKQGLTILRSELVSGHMAANLVDVKKALDRFSVTGVTGWLDSTVALCWVKGQGQYKQFVQNRVRKNGAVWLSNKTNWPPNPLITESDKSRVETKLAREIFNLAIMEEDSFDELLGKFNMWKVMRVGAWVTQLVTNLRVREGERTTSPLKTKETQKQITFWVKKAQARHEASSVFQEDKLQLNLQRNEEDIYECRGITTGDVSDVLTGSRPIYREARNECSHSNFAWGSGSYDDQITGNILDSTTATIDEEGDKEMQRL